MITLCRGTSIHCSFADSYLCSGQSSVRTYRLWVSTSSPHWISLDDHRRLFRVIQPFAQMPLWGDTGISLRPRRTLDFSCACCKLVHFTAGLCHDFHVTNVFLFFFFFLIDGGRFSVPHCSSWVQRSAAQRCASPVLIVSGLLFLFSPPERCEQQQHVQYSN